MSTAAPQCPVSQRLPAAQARSQPPQWNGFVAVSTQDPPHDCWLPGQTQLAFWQSCSAEHAVVQLPQ
jgi:hypothetical protein